MEEEILQGLMAYLCEELGVSSIDPDAEYKQDLDVDSLGTTELVLHIEEVHGVRVPDFYVANTLTTRAMARAVAELKALQEDAT